MPLFWSNQYANDTETGHTADQVPLGGVPIGATLRRVVVNWRIQIDAQETGTLFPWYVNGVLSLIEFTQGSPPPLPVPIPGQANIGRDILWSQLEFPGDEVIFAAQHDIPGQPRVGQVDVSVSRSAQNEAGVVWWNWGLPEGVVPGIAIGYWRIWSRVLVEQD